MNKDIRLSIGFFNSIKTKRLQAKLGDAGIISLQKLWIYTAVHKPKGVLSGYDPDSIEMAAEWAGAEGLFVDTLLSLSFLEKTDNGYSIHDWEEHNGYAAHSDERVNRAKKGASARWNNEKALLNNATSNALSINKQCFKHEKALLNNAYSYAPTPTPTPTPTPYSSDFSEIEKIVTYLNKKTGKSFNFKSPQTFTYIEERIKDGFKYDDFIKVIDNKCTQWLNDTKFNQYLRPQTLFGIKFEGYLNETPATTTESTVIRSPAKTSAELDAEIDAMIYGVKKK